MSVRKEIADVARDAAIDAAWRQWVALGAAISGRPAEAVIDPEALLLLSCALRNDERRLDDVLAWWAVAGAGLLSVQRVRTLARSFPGSARTGLAAFAHAALGNSDLRWKPVAAADDVLASRGKRGGEPELASYPSLMLRLRAAFGVGVKADVLAVLLAMGGGDETVRGLMRATGYTAAAIRRALQEMQAARIVSGTSHRPASYYADLSAWSAFLCLERPRHTAWRYHGEVFAFLLETIAWGEESDDDGYVAASTARDIVEAHKNAFDLNRITFAGSPGAVGTRYLEVFRDIVSRVTEWLATSV